MHPSHHLADRGPPPSPPPRFPIVGYDEEGRRVSAEPGSGSNSAGFGLLSDRDLLWTKDRETQDDQVGGPAIYSNYLL